MTGHHSDLSSAWGGFRRSSTICAACIWCCCAVVLPTFCGRNNPQKRHPESWDLCFIIVLLSQRLLSTFSTFLSRNTDKGRTSFFFLSVGLFHFSQFTLSFRSSDESLMNDLQMSAATFSTWRRSSRDLYQKNYS